MVVARSSLFICGIQRAGTWLLAHLLRSTGVAGHAEDFFDPEGMQRFRADWGVTSDADYLDHVRDLGTTPNGVFGTKLAWNARDQLLFKVRRVTGDYDSADLTAIEALFPEPHFVWLRRGDDVAQAVSWAKAAQTGQYAAHQVTTSEPIFDFEQIDGLLHLVRNETGVWRRWFAANGIEPFEITYEQLCADPPAGAVSVLDFLGLVAAPGATIAAPPELTKQADAVNADWIARYRAIAGGN